MAVVLIGTLDTKGRELAFVRDLLRAQGLETIVIDVGSGSTPAIEPDIDRDEVFRRAGMSPRSTSDRGEAVALASEGAIAVVADLAARGLVDGVFGLGGSAGTVIGSAVMRSLPFGLPKVMVSTVASGQTRPFVGSSDIAMFHPVADLAGLNRLTRRALGNAASALAGMVRASDPAGATGSGGPVVSATMFGVTTPCVDRARLRLESLGFEVLVFHATGTGGQAMERLIRDGQIDAVLDLTTTELADELVGGILSAGSDRLAAAIERGIPQVVGVGALDMVNFGPRETVPGHFEGRSFHVHNPSVTLMRTTASENAELGRRLASQLCRSAVPIAVMLPLGGISALDSPGRPFHDPGADSALFQAIRVGLSSAPQVRLIERREHINDPAFADAATDVLAELIRSHTTQQAPAP